MPYFPQHSTAAGAKPNRGFALVLTLALLALLVLILAGLAVYTRVEMRTIDNSIKQAQARQNALMALNIALAQLQKYAGPDTRVTATAEAFGGAAGTRYFTGVWDSGSPDVQPLTWLVSGNEITPSLVTPAAPGTRPIEMVGVGSSGVPRDVVVPAQDIYAPGRTEGEVVGRYAWWVGDENVKAHVSLRDQREKVDYAPYLTSTPESQRRLLQQVIAGANPITPDAPSQLFDPTDEKNVARFRNVVRPEQLGFLQRMGSEESVGAEVVRTYFHTWTTFSQGVLSDVKNGGLKRDVSLNHRLLGEAFAAWANFTNAGYLEDFKAPQPPIPTPEYSDDPIRRRYRIGALAVSDPASARPHVAPVLSYFYLLFGVQKTSASAPFRLSVRWAAALWNPYTSSLYPEDLVLEVSGLPESISFLNAESQSVEGTVSLRAIYGDRLRLRLPWDSSGAGHDRKAWLPGRVYNWVSTPADPFVLGSPNSGRFYSRDIPGFANGLIATVAGPSTVNGNTPLAVRLGDQKTQLVVRLYQEGADAPLATYLSPEYDRVPISDAGPANGPTSQLGFLFRLGESYDTAGSDPGLWLKTAGMDPRSIEMPREAMRALPNGTNPSLYRNFVTINAPWRLIDRDISRGSSFNEDIPLFELPRAPILSLGGLQHLYIAGARPFSVGNSWGAKAVVETVPANQIFDRFFVSGLEPGVLPPTTSRVLPNHLFQIAQRKLDGSPITIADIRSAPAEQSSGYLTVAGAFNVNSVSVRAWGAVLRSLRNSGDASFTYLDPQPTSDNPVATNASTGRDTVTRSDDTRDAQFFRFPQSAQEVFASSATYIQSSTTGTGQPINAHLFRRGRRVLSDAQVAGLAEAIVKCHLDRCAALGLGPFRSMEEFLNPVPGFPSDGNDQQSLLDYAIARAEWLDETGTTQIGINAKIAEYSSSWLTQADVLTALAPILTARSDTFLIRAFGEALNPATGQSGSVAYCEALVQRVPHPVGTDAARTEFDRPGPLGRTFKIISIRWLHPSEI
jgi:hypothetical protein